MSWKKQLSKKHRVACGSQENTAHLHVLSLFFSWKQEHKEKKSTAFYNLFVNWARVSKREGSLHLTAGAVR